MALAWSARDSGAHPAEVHRELRFGGSLRGEVRGERGVEKERAEDFDVVRLDAPDADRGLSRAGRHGHLAYEIERTPVCSVEMIIRCISEVPS